MSYLSQFTEEGQSDRVEEQFLGRAIVKLEIRMESVEVKVTSLTKIIRLLQHYSEKKDLQYEKETHNMEIFDSRLSKIDSMETKLGHTLSRFDELTKHFHLALRQNRTAAQTLQRQTSSPLATGRQNQLLDIRSHSKAQQSRIYAPSNHPGRQ